ncbi:MAG: nucleotidyltransferase domain-containing protein [Bacteroidota bacterium]|jgi:predicted nucleotidyltransferase|nr:nucleotidyltransferase domain-containing protein [Bacteroidota bacterium]
MKTKKTRQYDEAVARLLQKKEAYVVKDFAAVMPGAPAQTVYSRIRALVESGVLSRTGRGRYAKGSKLPYRLDIPPKMLEINRALAGQFVGISFSVAARGDNYWVETEKARVDEFVEFLSGRFHRVFSSRQAQASRIPLRDHILVKPLISEAPLLEQDGLLVPSLEKSLVDTVADRDLLSCSDADLRRIFQRAFEVHSVNRSRLLRYAGRRGLLPEVSRFVGSLNEERIRTISLIQDYLATQPIVRAWLFGSYARGEERPDSDIDLLVDYEEQAQVSLLDHSRMMLAIQDRVAREVDLVENRMLLPFAVKNANEDKYVIYERGIKRSGTT